MDTKVELTVQFSCGCGWQAKKDGSGAVVRFKDDEPKQMNDPAQRLALGHATVTGHTLTITGLVRANA